MPSKITFLIFCSSRDLFSNRRKIEKMTTTPAESGYPKKTGTQYCGKKRKVDRVIPIAIYVSPLFVINSIWSSQT
jgi:hypothetical protein